MGTFMDRCIGNAQQPYVGSQQDPLGEDRDSLLRTVPPSTPLYVAAAAMMLMGIRQNSHTICLCFSPLQRTGLWLCCFYLERWGVVSVVAFAFRVASIDHLRSDDGLLNVLIFLWSLNEITLGCLCMCVPKDGLGWLSFIPPPARICHILTSLLCAQRGLVTCPLRPREGESAFLLSLSALVISHSVYQEILSPPSKWFFSNKALSRQM